MTKTIPIMLLIFLLCSVESYATKLFSYDFETWGGSVSSTSDYWSGSGYSASCTTHENATEVVTGYDGLSPHGGSYMFLDNMTTYALDPSVSGITAGAANPQTQIGLGSGSVCDSYHEWSMPSNPSKLYVQMWVSLNGWENTVNNSGLKLLAFYDNDGSGYPIIMIMDHYPDDPLLALYVMDSDVGYQTYTYGDDLPDLFDGNWHKIGFMVDYDEGDLYMWYDVTTPTLDNATLTKSVNPSGIDDPVVIKPLENWSGNNPTGIAWGAIDDFEVWDGLPTSSGSSSMTSGPGATSMEASGGSLGFSQ